MSGAHVSFPLGQLSGAVDAAQLALFNSRRELLENIGIQLLSFSQEAYTVKSTGETGDDGIRWAPITVQTILARLRRAGHLKSHSLKTSKLPKGVAKAPRQRVAIKVTSKGAKGQGNSELFDALAKAGVVFRDKKTGKRLTTGKRAAVGAHVRIRGKSSLKNTVNVSGYEIGVDKGLQRASATPGYKANPNQVFDITEEFVTVGYGMNYSKYFDAKRKLFPDTLPAEWVTELESLAAQHNEQVLIESFT